MVYTITALILFILSLTVWDYTLSLGVDANGGIICKTKKTQELLIFACVLLILHDGLRWEIGTDWESYYNFFVTGEDSHMDIGYRLLNNIIHFFSSSYTFFLLVIASFTYIIFGKMVYKYSVNALMSLCILYCSMLGLLGCNRQIIAMLITICSLRFIIDRKLIWFLLCIGIAVTFHVTAILFLPAYLIANIKYSNKLALAICFASFLIGVTHLINRIPFVEYLAYIDNMQNSTTSFSSYLDSFDGTVSLMGSLKRFAFVSFAVYAKEKTNDKRYNMFLLFYIIGSCLYLVFNGSVLQLVAGRGTLYYNIYECLVIPTAIYKFPVPKRQKKLLWFVFFVFYFYIMWRDMNGYILEVGYDIYNPYKCVLF